MTYHFNDPANNHSPSFRTVLTSLWLVVLTAVGAPAWAEQVSTLDELTSALSKAKGGETILLEAGDYGKLSLSSKSNFNTEFSAPVTIASADPDQPAVFSGLNVRDSANLVFDSLHFDYTFQDDQHISAKPFSVTQSNHITIRNSVFDGDMAKGVSKKDNGFGYGYGLYLDKNADIKIENNEIFDFNRGIVAGGTDGLAVVGNDVHSIRSDGMDFVKVTNTLIERNYIHDFKRSPSSGDHSDMIQFWTKNTSAPSTDVTIRGNLLLSGEGSSTQSIFMRNDMVDRGLAGDEMFYRNILIEENVIVNGHVHGITLGETEGATVRRNTLLRNHKIVGPKTIEKKVTIPRIKIADSSRKVKLVDNIGPLFQESRSGWSVSGNLVAQDVSTMRPGYYHKLFTDAQTGDPRQVDTFAVRKGSEADREGLGASILRADP